MAERATIRPSMEKTQRLVVGRLIYYGLELVQQFPVLGLEADVELSIDVAFTREAARLFEDEQALTPRQAEALVECADVGLRGARAFNAIKNTTTAEEGLRTLAAAVARRR